MERIEKMAEGNNSKNECNTNDAENCCNCHQKATPRTEGEQKQLRNRLNRITGQLNGIGKMLEENRYCGDILTQVAAVESALQAFGYLILQEHMETCVVEEIQKGNLIVVEEAVDLMKKLK
nr:metal-sensing transcriptional repressor [uncultured Acetatifactor sp.]